MLLKQVQQHLELLELLVVHYQQLLEPLVVLKTLEVLLVPLGIL